MHSSECKVAVGEEVVSCSFRGRLRLEDAQIYAGDMVHVFRSADSYLIERVNQRKNLLVRPPVANVDQAIVVTAITQPPLDLAYIDRILISWNMKKSKVSCVSTSRTWKIKTDR